MQIFEKLAAFVFLLLLVGMVLFLVFIPLPEASEKVVLMIIGGLMTSATTALPKLFGQEDTKKRLAKLEAEHALLKGSYDQITRMLVERHVVHGEGVIPKTLKRLEDKSA